MNYDILQNQIYVYYCIFFPSPTHRRFSNMSGTRSTRKRLKYPKQPTNFLFTRLWIKLIDITRDSNEQSHQYKTCGSYIIFLYTPVQLYFRPRNTKLLLRCVYLLTCELYARFANIPARSQFRTQTVWLNFHRT